MPENPHGGERFREIRRLFDQAIELPEAERSDFLDRTCDRDPQMRAQIERMLVAPSGRVTALGVAIGDVIRGVAVDQPSAGANISHYRLVRPLGEGGMGEVWLAEQREPVQRNVALKLIKPGMDSRHFIARFESERQALAVMSHPNIARIFDGGTTDRGTPYFAMEHVEGEPIAAFCDSRRLDVGTRLALFLHVCDAVQHAHLRGVIHRDLKPSNILVQETAGGEPECKVIDFGISKVIEPDETGPGTMTAFGQLLGTPEFMSPEQAAGHRDIDTRTDVYSLGVVLYELLTGTTPLQAGPDEPASFENLSRRIVARETPAPSRRLSTMGPTVDAVAEGRGTDAERLARSVRGDLDWITLRALEKDRERRYQSPADLAADIRRHLHDEPVHAGPPEFSYRLGKFVRRHTAAVIAAGMVAVALLAGAGLATYGLWKARASASEARAEAATAQEVTSFLVGLFQVPDPSQARGEQVSAREVLDRGAERIRSTLGERPESQARMMTTIAETYGGLGFFDDALRLDQDALAILEKRLGADHPDTLALRLGIGELYSAMGTLEEAEAYLGATVEAMRRVQGPDALETLHGEMLLAEAVGDQTRYADAVGLLEDILERRRRSLGGEDDAEVYRILVTLGAGLCALPDYGRGVPLMEEGLAGQRRLLGDDHPATLDTMILVTEVYRDVERYDDGKALILEAIATIRNVLGEDHVVNGEALLQLAGLYNAQGQFGEAETLYLEALDVLRSSVGEEHPAAMIAVNNLGFMYKRAGRNEEAEPLLRAAYEIQLRVLGPDHANTLMAKINLGDLYTTMRSLPESEALLRTAVADARRILPEQNVLTGVTLHHYGRCLTALGRYQEAESFLLESYEMLVATAGADNRWFTGRAAQLIVELYEAWGRADKVAEWSALVPAGS